MFDLMTCDEYERVYSDEFVLFCMSFQEKNLTGFILVVFLFRFDLDWFYANLMKKGIKYLVWKISLPNKS